MIYKLRQILYNIAHKFKLAAQNLLRPVGQLRLYKHFRCHGCKAKLRVSRGKGKIQITCPRCGLRFKGRS